MCFVRGRDTDGVCGSYTALHIYRAPNPKPKAAAIPSHGAATGRHKIYKRHKHTYVPRDTLAEEESVRIGEALPETARAVAAAVSTLARAEEEEEETQRRIQQDTAAEPWRPPVPRSLRGLPFGRPAELPTPISPATAELTPRQTRHTTPRQARNAPNRAESAAAGQESESPVRGKRREEGGSRRGRGG